MTILSHCSQVYFFFWKNSIQFPSPLLAEVSLALGGLLISTYFSHRFLVSHSKREHWITVQIQALSTVLWLSQESECIMPWPLSPTLLHPISAHLSTEEHTENVLLLISMMPQTMYSSLPSAATTCLQWQYHRYGDLRAAMHYLGFRQKHLASFLISSLPSSSTTFSEPIPM